MIARTSQRKARTAVAAVEMAVVFTILIPFLVGTWEVGRLVEVQQALDNAVREGGRQAASGVVAASSSYITTSTSSSTVPQIVVNELAGNGITCTTAEVTVWNITQNSNLDPTLANPLDQYQVSVSIPFNSVRWIILGQVTSVTTLNASAVWVSMRDSTLVVDTTVPAQ